MQASCVLSPQARKLSLPETCSKPRARLVETDARTHMLLAKPIAPTILRLAVPNSTVMIVQILIGLLEVYFVSRTGVDALAGVSPVFPLVSLVVAIAQGALGGGIVTTVARVLGAGRIGDASEFAWYAVVLGVPLGIATTVVMVALGPTLYAHMGISGNALEIAISYSSIIFAGAGDLVVQPPDGGGSRHRQLASSGDCGLRRRFDSRPAFTGPDLRRLWLSGAWSLGRRCRDACVLCVRNAGLRRLSLGRVRRAQAIVSCAKTFAGAGACHSPCRRNVGCRLGHHESDARDRHGLCGNGRRRGPGRLWCGLAARVSSGAAGLWHRRSGRDRDQREPWRRSNRASRKGVLDRRSDGLRPDRTDRTGRGCLSATMDWTVQPGSVRAAS